MTLLTIGVVNNVDKILKLDKSEKDDIKLCCDWKQKCINSNQYISISSVTVDQMLTDESYKRRRYRPASPLMCRWNQVEGDISIALAGSFYRYVLSTVGKEGVYDKYCLEYVLYNRDLTKEIQNRAFKYRDEYSSDWRLLCHLTRLRDYVVYDEGSLLEDLESWLEVKEHYSFVDNVKFGYLFEKCLSRFINAIICGGKYINMSFDEFVENPTL